MFTVLFVGSFGYLLIWLVSLRAVCLAIRAGQLRVDFGIGSVGVDEILFAIPDRTRRRICLFKIKLL